MAKRELKPIEKYSVDELISGLSKLKSEAVKADEALDKTREKVEDLTGSAENLNDTLNDTTSVLKKLFANRKGKNKTFFSDEDKKQAEKFTKNIQDQILANQQLAKLEKSISTGRVKYYTDEANALKHVKKAFEDYQSALAKNKQNDINKKSSDMLRWGHAYEALLPDGMDSQLHTLGDEFIKHWNDVKDKVYDKTGGLSMYSKESFREMFDLMKDMEKNGFNFELFKPAQIKFIEKTTEQVDKLTSSIEKMEDAIPKKSSNGLNDFFKDVERRVSAFNKKWEKGASETQKNLISLYQDMSYYKSKGGKNKEVLDILSSFEDNRETPLSNKNFAQLSNFTDGYIPEMLKVVEQVTTAIEEQINMTEQLTDVQKLNNKPIEEKLYLLKDMKKAASEWHRLDMAYEKGRTFGMAESQLLEKFSQLESIYSLYDVIVKYADGTTGVFNKGGDNKNYHAGDANEQFRKQIDLRKKIIDIIFKENEAQEHLNDSMNNFENIRFINGIAESKDINKINGEFFFDMTFGKIPEESLEKLGKQIGAEFGISFQKGFLEACRGSKVLEEIYNIGQNDFLDEIYKYISGENGFINNKLNNKAQKFSTLIQDFENHQNADPELVTEYIEKIKKGQIALSDALVEYENRLKTATTLPLFEESSGQLAFIDGIKEAEFTEQKIIEDKKEVNELLEGQITLEEHLLEIEKERARIQAAEEKKIEQERSEKLSKIPRLDREIRFLSRFNIAGRHDENIEKRQLELDELKSQFSMEEIVQAFLKAADEVEQSVSCRIDKIADKTKKISINKFFKDFEFEIDEVVKRLNQADTYRYRASKLGGGTYVPLNDSFNKYEILKLLHKKRNQTSLDDIYTLRKDFDRKQLESFETFMPKFKLFEESSGQLAFIEGLEKTSSLIEEESGQMALFKVESEKATDTAIEGQMHLNDYINKNIEGQMTLNDLLNEQTNESTIPKLTEEVKELTQAEIEAAEKAKDFGRVFGISNQNALKEISDVILAYKQTPTIDLKTDENGYLIADAYDDEFALFEESAMSAGKTIEDVIDVVSKHLKLSKKDVIDYAESWKQVRNYVSNSKILISDKDKADMGNDAASILSTIGRGNIVQKDGIDITKLLEAMNEDLRTTFVSLTTTQDAYRELYEFLKYKPLRINVEGLPDSIREVVGQLLNGTYHGQGKYKVSSPKISNAKFSNQDVINVLEQEADVSTESTMTIVSNLEEQKRIAQDTSNEIVKAEGLKRKAYQDSEKFYGTVEDIEFIPPDPVAIKHTYQEKGDKVTKISDTYRVGMGETTEVGYELDKKGQFVPFIKNLTDITQLEKEAIKWTNKLTLAQADLNAELRQPLAEQSGLVINALNNQIDEYDSLIKTIDKRAEELAQRPEANFSFDDYRKKVDSAANTYRIEIAAKTAKQIRIENEKALKAEGKIEQMRSKYRKNASKIDDVFKNTTEYKELEKVINSFSKLEDISKVEKAFNNIENVIATFKRNAKGLETLDTVKSALNQKSSLGDEVKQYELKLLSLGYTADEIKDKLSDLYTTAKTIQDISLTDADADNNNVVKFGEELKRFYQLKNQLESNIKLETEQGKRTTNLYRELTKLENERYRIKQQLIKLDIDDKSDEVLLNRLKQINAEMLSLTDLKVDLEKLGVTDFHGEDVVFSNLRESHNVQLEENKKQALIDKEKKSVDELNKIYNELEKKRRKQYELEKALKTLSSKQKTEDAKEFKKVSEEINELLEKRNKLSQYDNTGRRESYETYDLQLQKDLINDIIDAYGNANDKLRLYQAEANTPGNTKSYDAQIQQQKDKVDSLRIAAEQAADEMDRLSKAGKASKQEQWDTRAKFNNATANSDTASKAQDTEQSNKNKQAVIDEKEALDLLKKSLENVVKAYGQLALSAKNGSDSLLFKSNSKIFNDAMQQMQDYVDLAKNVGVSDGKINILQNDYFAKASSSVQQGGISSIDKYLNDIEKVEEKLRESGQLTEDAKQNFQGLREVFVNLVSDTDFSDGNELQKFILSLASLGNGLQSELDKISKQSKLTWINDQIQELDKLSYKSDDVKSKLTELKAKVAAYESAKQSGDKELINKAEIDLLKQAPGLIAKIQQLASGKGNLIDESIGKVTNLEDLNRALLEYAKNHGYVKAMGSSLKTSNGEVTGTFIDQNGAVVKLTASMDQMRNAMKLISTTQRGAVGLFGSFKEALKSVGKSLTFYFSGAALIRRFFGEFRKGIDVLKKYDSALTNISYTMDMSKDQLDTLGQSAVDMAKDLSLSLDNTLKIYQIYANMQTTAEEIAETARPTAILSNLSGVDASTASDQIQGILNQFNMLKDANVDAAATSMHVVDVLDKISANVAIDYAKGIGIITDAVTATGSAAADAGMSYEQLAAVSAKVAERTREDGSSIGNAIKTILTRISKVGKMPGYADEVDNETLSKASESLNEIGIEVYNADGSFRNISVILGELAEKWDGLTDAQQSNISYNVAATRQSNKFRAILEAWTSATELATDATNSFGNAEANQEKYLESYNGKLQQIKTQLDAFWLALFNSDAISDVLDFIIELTKGFNNLAEAITPLGALLVGFTGILGGITAGKYIKGKGLLNFIQNFGRTKMFVLFKYAEFNKCSLGY